MLALFIYIKMYMWSIDVHRRGIRNRTITNITLSCVFSTLRISTPFDDKVFTEDYKIPTEGEEIYSTRFNVYENNIAEFIRSQLYNKVVGERIEFISGIEHLIDMFDIYAFPWGGHVNTITGLQKINDLMFDTLLI